MNRTPSGMLIDNNEREYELDIDHKFNFTEGGPVALIDADPIAYSAAAVCDTSTYRVSLNGQVAFEVEGGVTDLYASFAINNKAEWDALLLKNPDVTCEKIVVADADPKAMFHTIKAQVRKIIKATGAGSFRLFLTDGDSNFRVTQNIATVLKYKGNRSLDSKPSLLGAARNYLLDELGAEMCVGLEADDKLSILHNEAWESAMLDAREFYAGEPNVATDLMETKAMELSKTVLVTIDKDIKMRAGKFLNPDQDLGIEDILPLGMLHLEVKTNKAGKKTNKLHFNGLKGFYAQILKGDDCDNIPGVYFCGDTRVFEVLKDCKDEEELFKATLAEIYEGFHREHLKSLDGDITKRVEAAIENGAKDTPSNRSKLRKKFKGYMSTNVQYCEKHYYHWGDYLLKEDGTVSRDLDQSSSIVVRKLTPLKYMKEVARLVYMLVKDPVDGSDDHLWVPPNIEWAKSVHNKYLDLNLTRIATPWVLDGEL